MTADRTIGRTVKIKTYQALVELLPETSSYVKSSYGGLYAIAVINSFVVVPVGSERVVAIVTSLDMAEDAEASLQNRQMLVIARPRRTMWISMIGTITQSMVRSGSSMASNAIRNSTIRSGSRAKKILDIILAKPKGRWSARLDWKVSNFTDYDVSIEIDQFFGKHAAILGNTGSGKSCTATALIRAVLDLACRTRISSSLIPTTSTNVPSQRVTERRFITAWSFAMTVINHPVFGFHTGS